MDVEEEDRSKRRGEGYGARQNVNNKTRIDLHCKLERLLLKERMVIQ